MAGYSGTPLPKKLGIAPGHHVAILGAPEGLDLGLFPVGVKVVSRLSAAAKHDEILLFVRSSVELAKKLNRARDALATAGGLWVCWPKKSSGVKTDVSEDVIRGLALTEKLVDVKVCAIDATWSGLRLVRRVANREPAPKKPTADAGVVEALEAAIARSARARHAWSEMAPSHRRRWIGFVEEAKRDATRKSRIAKVVAELAATH